MNLGNRLRAGAISAGMLILVAGCTSSTAVGPTSTAFVSPSVTPSVIDPSSLHPSASTPPPSPSSDAVESSASTAVSSDISPQEAADRAAIEAQWIKFWDVYQGIVRTTPDDRQAMAQSVAVTTLADKMVAAAEKASLENKDNYGEVVHHVFWQFDVAGKSSAVIADCLDQSNAGTVDTSTGTLITTGPERANMRGELVRGDDGIWRVKSITSLNSSPC